MNIYLFILSPPYCGSTVLWRLLATSPNVSTLRVEGQHLGKTKQILRRASWDSNSQIPWNFVKDAWEEEWDLNKPILLEKSPPHLLRAFEIEQVFNPAHFILIMRNPYAFCEGYCRRQNKTMEKAAEFWVECAKFQKNNTEGLKRSIFFTYETFTENPNNISKEILMFLPQLDRLETNNAFETRSIIGYGEQKIYNFNKIKINQLSTKDIKKINSVLEQHLELVDFFGYELIFPTKYHDFLRYGSNLSLKVNQFIVKTRRISKKIQRGIK